MNTRILHIFGEENADKVFHDGVESGKIDEEQLWQSSFENDEKLTYNTVDGAFGYKAYKFGDIDPRFIDFVRENFIANSVYSSDFVIMREDDILKI